MSQTNIELLMQSTLPVLERGLAGGSRADGEPSGFDDHLAEASVVAGGKPSDKTTHPNNDGWPGDDGLVVCPADDYAPADNHSLTTPPQVGDTHVIEANNSCGPDGEAANDPAADDDAGQTDAQATVSDDVESDSTGDSQDAANADVADRICIGPPVFTVETDVAAQMIEANADANAAPGSAAPTSSQHASASTVATEANIIANELQKVATAAHETSVQLADSVRSTPPTTKVKRGAAGQATGHASPRRGNSSADATDGDNGITAKRYATTPADADALATAATGPAVNVKKSTSAAASNDTPAASVDGPRRGQSSRSATNRAGSKAEAQFGASKVAAVVTNGLVEQPSSDATNNTSNDDTAGKGAKSAATSAESIADTSVRAPKLTSTARRGVRATAGDDVPRVDPARFVGRVAKAIHTAHERGSTLQLRLSPPELGSLRLELTVQDGVMTAALETETPGARRILLDHLPALRDRLSEQNIRVERFDVDVRRDSQEGHADSQASQQQQQQNQSPNHTAPRRSVGTRQTAPNTTQQISRVDPMRSNGSGINFVA